MNITQVEKVVKLRRVVPKKSRAILLQGLALHHHISSSGKQIGNSMGNKLLRNIEQGRCQI